MIGLDGLRPCDLPDLLVPPHVGAAKEVAIETDDISLPGFERRLQVELCFRY